MAEELDISNIITNNVNGYLNPKNKIYRLNVCDASLDFGQYDGIQLRTTIKIKTIEVIDDEEEYNKLVHNIPFGLGWESDDEDKIAKGNTFEIGYLMYKRCSYMYKDIFDILIKHKRMRWDDENSTILLNYKQIA
jgi:hypothetical protein